MPTGAARHRLRRPRRRPRHPPPSSLASCSRANPVPHQTEPRRSPRHYRSIVPAGTPAMEHIDPKKLTAAPVEPEAAAKAAGLHYVDDSAPGFSRKKVGSGFGYRDQQGKIIRDAEVIKRIRSIGIPPAYTDVWICPDPRGHIQATGRDAKGRKQYRYHPRWSEIRDSTK